MKGEEFICGDCKGITKIKKGKKGSKFIEMLLWITLVVPGIFYSLWRLGRAKHKCRYCGSDFLLPRSLESENFIRSITKKSDT